MEGHFGGGQGSKWSCHGIVVPNEMTAKIGKVKKMLQLLLEKLRYIHLKVSFSHNVYQEGNCEGLKFALLSFNILYNEFSWRHWSTDCTWWMGSSQVLEKVRMSSKVDKNKPVVEFPKH